MSRVSIRRNPGTSKNRDSHTVLAVSPYFSSRNLLVVGAGTGAVPWCFGASVADLRRP